MQSSKHDPLPAPATSPADETAATAFPPQFVERLERILPPGSFNETIARLRTRQRFALRLNTLRGPLNDTRTELQEAGIDLQPVSWLAESFTVDSQQRSAVVSSAALLEGRIYIQNLSSMLAPLVLAPQPGEEVLDLAAAPGGKTLQMAALMHDCGRIAAVEVVRGRYYKLRENIRRGAATIVETYRADGRTVGSKTPERFDRVLLDAPCSSEARFRADEPASWSYWSQRKIADQARKQKGLLRSAIKALKVGGSLLYVTCSFAPEENEQVVADALRRCGPSVELVPFELPVDNVQPGITCWNGRQLPDELISARRVLPSLEMDGMFLCKLTKVARLRH